MTIVNGLVAALLAFPSPRFSEVLPRQLGKRQRSLDDGESKVLLNLRGSLTARFTTSLRSISCLRK